MDLLQAVVLALVQGLTEFLPISSSAHLILVPNVLGWPDQGLAFDVVVHVGTLVAVIAYFRHELAAMARDWLRSVRDGRQVGESRLAWGVILGTIPAGLVGLLLGGPVEEHLRSPLVIAATTLGFGLALWLADARGKSSRSEHSLSWRDILIIGVAQAFALIPGTSRSGVTMTAGRALGLSRPAAARFSFLLAIPIILLAGGSKTLVLLQEPTRVDWLALLAGGSLSAASAYLCIHYFLRLIARVGMLPFIFYRLVLGVVLLLVFA